MTQDSGQPAEGAGQHNPGRPRKNGWARRWARRLLGAAIGIALGWWAAGYW